MPSFQTLPKLLLYIGKTIRGHNESADDNDNCTEETTYKGICRTYKITRYYYFNYKLDRFIIPTAFKFFFTLQMSQTVVTSTIYNIFSEQVAGT